MDNNAGRGPRVLDWSDERKYDGSIIVTLTYGWAFDPDPDERVALHVRGFDNVKNAMTGIRAAKPCACDRCKSKVGG